MHGIITNIVVGVLRSLYGMLPVGRAGAYTQTYSTADKTHANPTATALTDSTGATPDNTIENVPAATAADIDASAAKLTTVNTSLTAIENNLSDLTDEVNKLIADVADLKQLVNSLIDDLQANGTVG